MARGMREGTESTEGKTEWETVHGRICCYDWRLVRGQSEVGCLGSIISQILAGTISSAEPSDPGRIQNGWSINYLCLAHDCGVDCLKITKDKSSERRIHTPDARPIIATRAKSKREARARVPSLTAVPRRIARSPHPCITAMSKCEARSPRPASLQS